MGLISGYRRRPRASSLRCQKLHTHTKPRHRPHTQTIVSPLLSPAPPLRPLLDACAVPNQTCVSKSCAWRLFVSTEGNQCGAAQGVHSVHIRQAVLVLCSLRCRARNGPPFRVAVCVNGTEHTPSCVLSCSIRIILVTLLPIRPTMAKCDAPGCTKKKLYAPVLGQPSRYCGVHSPLDWVDVVNKRCGQDGCMKQPSYGLPGGKAIRCAAHLSPCMVDVHNKKCGFDGCTTRPSYGLPIASNKPSRCAAHATDKMINLVVFLCKIEGCPTRPVFAKPGFKASRCAAHAQQGMVDVLNKRCDAPGCTKQPSFGPAVGERATKCATHAPPHWRDVKNRKCDSPAPNLCNKQPKFGFPGAGACRCSRHAVHGMVNVKSKRCEAAGCATEPSRGPPGGRRTYCSRHAGPGDVNLKMMKKKPAPKVVAK